MPIRSLTPVRGAISGTSSGNGTAVRLAAIAPLSSRWNTSAREGSPAVSSSGKRSEYDSVILPPGSRRNTAP